MLQLQADQQNGDGRRAGDKPASQAKHRDLSCRHVLSVKAPVDILRVRALVGVLPLLFNQRVFMGMIMVVVMVMVMVMMVVAIVMMIVWPALFPGSPRHPQGDCNDQHPGDQLEPGFGRMCVPAAAKP